MPEIARAGGRAATSVTVEPIARAAPFRANSRVLLTLSREHPSQVGELAMMSVYLGETEARWLAGRIAECAALCWPGDPDRLAARNGADDCNDD